MWNDKYVNYWSDEWDYAMNHTDNFSAEIRPKSQVDSHADNDLDSYDLGMGSDDSRVVKALEMIKNRGFADKNMTALDIGSGTGIFTIPFAEVYKKVTSVDISSGMQDIIRKKAELKGINNIDYKILNWHTAELKKEDMFKKYDLVLSSLNTRGIYNKETLFKMNNASKNGCCLVSFTGSSNNNHRKALDEIILGRHLQSAGGNDIIMPFNIIYNLGGYPDLSYSSIKWERKFSPEEAENAIEFKYWRFAEITNDVKAKIRGYVSENIETDGKYVERVEVPIGIMVWDAERVRANMK